MNNKPHVSEYIHAVYIQQKKDLMKIQWEHAELIKLSLMY